MSERNDSARPREPRRAADQTNAHSSRYNGAPRPSARVVRRPLTEEERRRILEKRRREARKKKAKLVFLFITLAVILGAVLLLVFGKGLFQKPEVKPTDTPIVNPTQTQGSSFANYTPQNTQPSDGIVIGENSVNVSDLSINESPDPTWLNILLMGLDTRNEIEGARSDTMIICSINKRTGDVKLSSIMRDTAISIEGHGLKRINSAFFYGGEKLAMKTVNECFGTDIQYYVTVDFAGFAVVAEALGGTRINITEAEMNEINDNAIEAYKISIKKGLYEYAVAEKEYYDTMLTEFGANIQLTGIQTLAYARIRKLEGGDYARVERQRRVLNALMTNLQNSNTAQLSALAVQCLPYIKTNMQAQDIISIANLVLNRESFTSAAEFRLPANGTYKEETRNEDSMLYDTDFALNAQKLKMFIYYEN